MKKVIFSAIALLAFTATSFAAEGKKEVKKAEVKTEVKVATAKIIVLGGTDAQCKNAANAAAKSFLKTLSADSDMTLSEIVAKANQVYDAAYAICKA